MQEIQIITYCDRCYQSDQSKTDAPLTIEVAIGTDSARLDLCQNCDQALLDPLRVLIKARAAAQRALDKATGTQPDKLAGPRSRPPVKAHCGQCGTAVGLRSRAQHARTRHDCEPEDLTWRFGDDVTQVWACTCGLTFPTDHGRTTHAHRTGHSLPGDLSPQPPQLP